ncbi:MAG: N-acetyltransferase DgcN [Pseudomonadota bacterium]|nr:N-acetyltransferase DgcN [Pseudomonadota bacterium]
MSIANPYLMFLGDAADQLAAKTANGVAKWRPEWCIGQFRLEGCKADVGLPDMNLEEAAEAGAKSLIVGVVNQGGYLPDSWVSSLDKALDLGMDIASGLHMRLTDLPGIAEKAEKLGRTLYDARHPTRDFATGKGHKRSGKRLLTVGTDVSVGKMFTSLAIEKEMKARGIKATFRATGQTGIFIAGDGVSVDAVVADFISGATEWLTPDNDDNHWDIVEGQGSLFHAAYAGVTLGLLHGAQPDAIVLCHEPTRPHMRGTPTVPMPDLQAVIDANISSGRLTNPNIRCIGVSVNTSALSDGEADKLLQELETKLGLPCVDAFRYGAARLVDAI